MDLSGEQRQQLQKALIDAFPNKSSLEQMISFKLNKNLNVIASYADLSQIVFELIKKAEAQNWIEHLVSAARRENPANQSLKDVAESLGIASIDESESLATQLWNIPYERNPFFTGRSAVLEEVRDVLKTSKSVAFSGLGGIGKTQVAIEYAYRHREEYQGILWVRASEEVELVSGFLEIARLLNLPVSEEKDESLVIAAVKQWLVRHKDWLLILDNADEIGMVRKYLPVTHQGNVLLTTRAQATGIYQRIEIKKMEPIEGALFLLRRAKLIPGQVGLDGVSEEEFGLAERISREMDGLPLALDQAGAFIEETPSSLAEYLDLYQQAGATLLEERGELAIDHPSVHITFSLAFEKVLERNLAAADLIIVCAFLAADGIPEEIFTSCGKELGENLGELVDKPLDFVKVIGEAGRFSLIYRNATHKTFDIHRLVQSVLRADMGEDNCRIWAERTVGAVTEVFPNAEYGNWQFCDRILPHGIVGINWIGQYQLESETSALLLVRTANYLNERGRYSEAEPLYQQALELWKRLLGSEHPLVASSLNDLAGLYHSQGRYGEAEPLYQQTLELWKRLLGSEHPDVANSLNSLAALYHSQGRYVEAELLYQQALELYKQLGDEHPDVATSLNNLAELYYLQGRYSEAEPMHQQALDMKKRLLGDEHPSVAFSLNNLANLYYSQGRYTEAEPLYQQALDMRKRLLGDEHPNVATSLNSLAELYRLQGRYAEAEPYLQQALDMTKRLLGDEHPDVATSLNNLAAVYYSQGRYAEAEPYFQQALELYKRLLGDEHPNVATSLHNLAKLYRLQGRYSEAEPLLQQGLELDKRLLGDKHPSVASSLNNLAELYRSQGRYSEAEPIYQQALDMRKRLLGSEHPDVALSLNNLAGLYKSQGRYTEAEPIYQQALEMRKRLLGDEHPDIALSLNNLAALYDSQGRYTEAEPLYQQALEIFEQTLGTEHPYTITVRNNLENF